MDLRKSGGIWFFVSCEWKPVCWKIRVVILFRLPSYLLEELAVFKERLLRILADSIFKIYLVLTARGILMLHWFPKWKCISLSRVDGNTDREARELIMEQRKELKSTPNISTRIASHILRMPLQNGIVAVQRGILHVLCCFLWPGRREKRRMNFRMKFWKSEYFH